MASNAVVFFAGVGTTLLSLRQDLASRLVFTKAVFDDTPLPTRASRATAAVRQSYFACLWRASV